VTLHVGPGTFLPVKVDDPREHRMHAEWGLVSPEAAHRINAARAQGGRVVAVDEDYRNTHRVVVKRGLEPVIAGEDVSRRLLHNTGAVESVVFDALVDRADVGLARVSRVPP